MIVIGSTVISDDIAEKQFVCNLSKCKGACCVEGDLGAPLEEEELQILADIADEVKPYLSDEGRKALDKQGLYIKDYEGDFSTPTIKGRECAYAIYDKNQTLKCGIEQAYLDGKVSWPKPISCHLYPARVTKYDHYEAVNYHHWHICSDACELGKELQVPVYKFLQNALTRKFGQPWFEKLEEIIHEREKEAKAN
jgi:hypothetical protein